MLYGSGVWRGLCPSYFFSHSFTSATPPPHYNEGSPLTEVRGLFGLK